DGASADLVGQQSAEARADRHPGEAGGGDEGAVGLREVPVDGQGGDDEGDQADVHRVQRPADAGGAQQPAVLAGEGEAVQALRAGRPAGRGGGRRRGAGGAGGGAAARGGGAGWGAAAWGGAGGGAGGVALAPRRWGGAEGGWGRGALTVMRGPECIAFAASA